MKVLVTGGTGYLGRAIVRALAAPRARHRSCSRAAAQRQRPAGRAHRRRRPRSRARSGGGATASTPSVTPPRSSASGSARPAEFDESTSAGLENVIDVCATLGIRGSSTRRRFSRCRRPGAAARSKPTTISGPRCGHGRSRARRSARGVPIVSLVPGVIYGPGTDRRQPGRAARPRSSRGTAAGHRRRRSPLVVRVRRRRRGGARAALERGEPGASMSSAARTLPQMRLFEIVRELAGRRCRGAFRSGAGAPGGLGGGDAARRRPAPAPDAGHRRDFPSRLAAGQRA